MTRKDDTLFLVWNPAVTEDHSQKRFEEELVHSLLTNPEVRGRYGILKKLDGSFEVSDLPRIKSFPPDVKDILREFLRTHSKPSQSVSQRHIPCESKSVKEMLGGLYAKLDDLSEKNYPQKLQKFKKQPGK